MTRFNVILGCTSFEMTSGTKLMWKTVFYAFIRVTQGKRARICVCATFWKVMRMAKNVCKMNFRRFEAFWIFARALTHGRTRTRALGCKQLEIVWDNIRHLNNAERCVFLPFKGVRTENARVSACARFFDKWWKWAETYAKWILDDLEHFEYFCAHWRADVRVRAR